MDLQQERLYFVFVFLNRMNKCIIVGCKMLMTYWPRAGEHDTQTTCVISQFCYRSTGSHRMTNVSAICSLKVFTQRGASSLKRKLCVGLFRAIFDVDFPALKHMTDQFSLNWNWSSVLLLCLQHRHWKPAETQIYAATSIKRMSSTIKYSPVGAFEEWAWRLSV